MCVSRPRRFGKSITARMIAAYYSKGCDSAGLFAKYKIAGETDFRKHLNQYNVIQLDVAEMRVTMPQGEDLAEYLQRCVIDELRGLYPEIVGEEAVSLPLTLAAINERTGQRFMIVIDEWDAVFREDKYDRASQDRYIDLLRGLFKGDYIALDREGLKSAVVSLLAGERCRVNVGTFENDMTKINGRDDVLTLLIHLGYLGYDADREEAYIPNEEVRKAFGSAVEGTDWTPVIDAIKASDRLLQATWNRDARAVAEGIEEAHAANASILKYNDENSLRCVVKLAYYNAVNEYTIVDEMPAGKGYADIVFLPRPGSDKPAMVVELKWNESAEGAIAQIKKRRYMKCLEAYNGMRFFHGNVLLVGINYDKDDEDKRHTCIIEEWSE